MLKTSLLVTLCTALLVGCGTATTEPTTPGPDPAEPAPPSSTSPSVGALPAGPDECPVRVDDQCFASHADACAAVDCPIERCLSLESYPAQVQCQPEASGTHAPEVDSHSVDSTSEDDSQSLVGNWVGDASCVPEMLGMQDADEASIAAVGAQITQNHYTFTETTLRQRVGNNPGSEQPYSVVSTDGSTITVEMLAPNRRYVRNEITIMGHQLRMTRDGALIICMLRE